MKYSFNQFQFDLEQQILIQDGDVFSLGEKPALLLSLFLRDPNKIHKKEDILQNVWADRFVSDQVVFQNISFLRSLFGSDAIKTFSRKGYQWQLPLEQVSVEKSFHLDRPEKIEPTVKVKLTQPILLILLLLSLALMAWFWFTPKTLTSKQTNLVEQNLIKTIASYQVSFENKQLKFNQLVDLKPSQRLFDSPFSTWQRQTGENKQWLLSTKFYQLNNAVVLRFQLQGAKRGWHDYIIAKSENLAFEQLQHLLILLGETKYLSIDLEYAALAQLTLLINQYPQQELLNQQLIKQYFEVEDYDRATAIVDQQLATAPSRLRQGLLNLDKTQITQWNQQWSVAKQSAEQAIEIFQELGLPQLESLALIELSWAHLIAENFRQGMQVLNQAASKARTSGEHLQEVKAHTTQSFMASKAGLTELMHTQLGLAEQLIELHQLGDEHQILLHYNLAWSAGSSMGSLPFYQKIMDMPFAPEYANYFYGTAENIRDSYIKLKDWHSALANIKPWQRLSFQILSKAHIAFGQANKNEAIKLATEAYRQAQIDHHKQDALDAALLLLQQSEVAEHSVKTNEFDAYLKQNATRRWLSQNKTALEKLNKASDFN